MNSRINIKDELKALESSLPADLEYPPFSVPEGYFEGLAALILTRIAQQESINAHDEIAQLSPLLAGISRTTPFTLPADYFKANLDALPVYSEEETSKVLDAVGKDMPYYVPSGYFEGIAESVMRDVKPQQGKVVNMNARNWMRMAAAAVVAGVITISGIIYFSGKQDIAVDNPQWVAKKLQNVSDRELEDFVKTTDVALVTIGPLKFKTNRTGDVKKLLQDVSDNELDAFLQQLPSDDGDFVLN